MAGLCEHLIYSARGSIPKQGGFAGFISRPKLHPASEQSLALTALGGMAEGVASGD